MRRLSSEILGFTPWWDFTSIIEMLPDQGVLFEIGPYKGKSTVSWAEQFEKANKSYHIHTVDFFLGITEKKISEHKDDLNLYNYLQERVCTGEEQLQAFKENIQGWDNITWEKVFFDENYKTDLKPNIVFYDGLHEYFFVYTTLTYWKNVPIIVVDDYDEIHAETIAAVNDFIKMENKTLTVIDKLAVIK